MQPSKKAISCLALLAAFVPLPAQNAGYYGPLLDQSTGWPAQCLAVHAVHMPGGNVLLFGLREYDPPGERLAFTRLYVRNSFTGQFLTEPYLDAWKVSGVHLFCAGHAILPDGKVLIAGGTIGTDTGITDTFLFDPVSLTISHAGWLSQARYYPSLVTLPNGNVATVSGWRTTRVSSTSSAAASAATASRTR